MPFQLIRNDITKMQVDAIVNAANTKLLGGGGVDGAIHRAAGPELLAECRTLGGCATGDAKMTAGYALPCRYIIHAVGPRWEGVHNNERTLLKSCYTRALELAQKAHCESIAFPLISSGIYGYPKGEALAVAMEAIGEFLQTNEMMVYLVLFDKNAMTISEALFNDIEEFIDDRYAASHDDRRTRSLEYDENYFGNTISFSVPSSLTTKASTDLEEAHPTTNADSSLNDILEEMDSSFSETLLRKIDASGMSDADCYMKANVSRKLFSKIRTNPHYQPSKPTVLAFAIALELSLDETQDLLMKAGFALSHSSKFDLIIEYFILREEYDIFAINEALFNFDQHLLGA